MLSPSLIITSNIYSVLSFVSYHFFLYMLSLPPWRKLFNCWSGSVSMISIFHIGFSIEFNSWCDHLVPTPLCESRMLKALGSFFGLPWDSFVLFGGFWVAFLYTACALLVVESKNCNSLTFCRIYRFPEALPKIDFAFYSSRVSNPAMVTEFEKAVYWHLFLYQRVIKYCLVFGMSRDVSVD